MQADGYERLIVAGGRAPLPVRQAVASGLLPRPSDVVANEVLSVQRVSVDHRLLAHGAVSRVKFIEERKAVRSKSRSDEFSDSLM